jgi:hypothetical protein
VLSESPACLARSHDVKRPEFRLRTCVHTQIPHLMLNCSIEMQRQDSMSMARAIFWMHQRNHSPVERMLQPYVIRRRLKLPGRTTRKHGASRRPHCVRDGRSNAQCLVVVALDLLLDFFLYLPNSLCFVHVEQIFILRRPAALRAGRWLLIFFTSFVCRRRCSCSMSIDTSLGSG